MSTWFITGCSTGLGRALAAAVLERGDNAVVTARNADTVNDLRDAHPDTALALSLDVTDGGQIGDAVRAGEDRFGAVDVLVNNAGYGYRAAVEEGDDRDIEQLFATNFFGAVGMIKAVLPGMRARHRGVIVNISSIGATICPEGSGYYAASKAALEGMSGSLRKELLPLGIAVITVEPGGFRTDFAGRSLAQSRTVINDYAETAGKRRIEAGTGHGTQPGDPAKAASVLMAAVAAAEPPGFLLLGQDAVDAYRRTVSDRLQEVAAWETASIATGFDG